MAHVSSNLTIKEETTFPLRYWELAWCSLILITGALGNLLVCLVIYKSSSVFRLTPFNMFLCSLAVTDMLLALVVLPNYVLSTSIFRHPVGIWGDVMCKTITGDFLTFYFSNVSGYALILITLERVRAVQMFAANTFKNSSRNTRTAWLSIVITWLIPFTVQCPEAFYLLEYKRNKPPVIGNHCIFLWGGKPTLNAKIYGAAILIFEGLIPLVIFACSFCYIGKGLLEEEKRVFGGTQRDAFTEGYRYYNSWQMVKRRQRTAKVLMVASVVYVVCWMPNKIMFFMVNYLGQGGKYSKFTWNCPVYQIGILIGFTGSCINPYLYAWQSKEFRKRSKKVLKSLLPKCLQDDFEYRQIENTN